MEAPKKVLIIEDEKDLQKALVTALSEEPYEILTADDGEEGLKLALQEHPDLVLLDLVLPKLDGYGVLEQLKGDEWGAHADVIVLTALSEVKNIYDALEAGGHEYLIKNDWKLEQVVERIKKKLEE